MTNENLINAYKWRRQVYYGTPAKRSLDLARADVAANVKRYPRALGAWNHADADGARWIENTGEAGLRFVGEADSIARSISHRGWYIDDNGSDTYRGAVLQLPARNGRPLFLAAYSESSNSGYRVDCSQLFTGEDSEGADAKRDAALAADEFARVEAEKAREWNDAWQAGSKWSDLGEDIKTARGVCLMILRERRSGKPIPPMTWQAALAQVRSYLEEISAARAKRAELVDSIPSHLVAAFNDGAGIQSKEA